MALRLRIQGMTRATRLRVQSRRQDLRAPGQSSYTCRRPQTANEPMAYLPQLWRCASSCPLNQLSLKCRSCVNRVQLVVYSVCTFCVLHCLILTLDPSREAMHFNQFAQPTRYHSCEAAPSKSSDTSRPASAHTVCFDCPCVVGVSEYREVH